MISVQYVDIPEYLHSSKFYEGLDPGDHSEISVPEMCFKDNTSINNETDFNHLLHTVRFWMLNDPHLKILTFLLTNNVPSCRREDSQPLNLLMSLPFGENYLDLQALPQQARITFAVRNDMGLDIVMRLHNLGNDLPRNMLELAAKRNRVDIIMRYAYFLQCPWGNTAKIATARGHVECLDCAFNNGCPKTAQLIDVAAEKGQLRSLQYLSTVFRLESWALIPAAKHGHLACLQYMHEQGVPWREDVSQWMVRNGHVDCLIYAHQHGCPLTSSDIAVACLLGDLVLWHYVVKHDCPIDHLTCSLAAASGLVPCLQYVHDAGGTWDAQTCELAAIYGHLRCLKYLHENGCPWDERVLMEALWNDHFHIAWYALLHGCPCDRHKRIFCVYMLTYLCLLARYVFPDTFSFSTTFLHMGMCLYWAVLDTLCLYKNQLTARFYDVSRYSMLDWGKRSRDVLCGVIVLRAISMLCTNVIAGFYS